MEDEKHRIMWEKLILPNGAINDDDDDDDEGEDGPPTYEDKDESPLTQILNSQQNPFIQLNTYNFWTMHTNFILNRPLLVALANMLGVESLDVVSPYRVYISIGKLFKESDVKLDIQNKLIGILNEADRTES